MKVGIVILISFLFVSVGLVFSADSQFIKLEKVAVSSLPEDVLAPDLKSVTVDDKGNVFAFAGSPNKPGCFVVKFDKNLEYLKHFGKDGKGPSEFTTKFSRVENRISIDTNGDVYVIDSNPSRFVIFDNNGKYREDILLTKNYSKYFGNIFSVRTVGAGTFIALQSRRELPPHALLFTLNPPLVKVRYPFVEKRVYGNYVSDYYGENCIIDADSNHVVFGNSQIYKLQVYDGNGKLKLEIEDKDRVMASFNDREMAMIVEKHFTPKSGYSAIKNNILARLNAGKSQFKKLLGEIKKSKNVIAEIKISGNRIYVFPVRDDITVNGKFPVEIYNLKGRMVKKGYFKERPVRIWKSSVFFYGRDEESDDPLILKYKIPPHLWCRA